jgi:hypothetical protein
VATKDNASQEAPSGPDLRGGTPDPCEYESGAPEETCQVPPPPREVRASARSRDGEDLGTGKGPVPTHVQTLLYAPRSGGPNYSKSLCVLVFFPFSN